jgi:hypothetical protein
MNSTTSLVFTSFSMNCSMLMIVSLFKVRIQGPELAAQPSGARPVRLGIYVAESVPHPKP